MNLQKHKPTTFSSRPVKVVIQLIAALALIFVGCGLLITGFIVPPPGEIHNSVLIAFGVIGLWPLRSAKKSDVLCRRRAVSGDNAGALFGIDYHYKYKSHNHEKDN